MIRTIALLSTCALCLAACGPGSGGPGTDGGTSDGGAKTGATSYALSSTLDLGTTCLDPGDVAVLGHTAYVACAGTFTGDGALAIVDLDQGTVKIVATGAAPGIVAIDGGNVYLGDMLDGDVLVVSTDGTVLHGGTDPVVLCPSDPANNVYQFISGLAPGGSGEMVASCFSTDEVVRFAVSDGATGTGGVKNATIAGRVVAGDGASALAPWHTDDLVVLDNLGGTASRVVLGATLTADVDRWQTGDVPNDVIVESGVAYVASSGSNLLQVLDLASKKTTAEVPTGDNTSPWSLALPDARTALVSLDGSDEVVVVDLAAAKITQRIAMPTGADLHPLPNATPEAKPEGMATVDDGRVLVTLTNLDPKTFAAAGDGLLVVLAPKATK